VVLRELRDEGTVRLHTTLKKTFGYSDFDLDVAFGFSRT